MKKGTLYNVFNFLPWPTVVWSVFQVYKCVRRFWARAWMRNLSFVITDVATRGRLIHRRMAEIACGATWMKSILIKRLQITYKTCLMLRININLNINNNLNNLNIICTIILKNCKKIFTVFSQKEGNFLFNLVYFKSPCLHAWEAIPYQHP